MGVLSQTFLADKLARRGGSQNLSTLSARTVIWEECLKEVYDPKVIHFIGYGEHGQAISGVSDGYVDIFPDDFYDEDALVVTHNFFFQVFFDFFSCFFQFFLLFFSDTKQFC